MSFKINAKHYEYHNYARKARKCRAFMAGELEVKDAGEEFLPKLSGQTKKEYEAMIARTLFYGASRRTRSALSGGIHRRPPTVDIPAGYDDWLSDITLQQTPFNIFAKQVTDEVLTTGKYVICVDYDELSGRPYCRGYTGESLINARTAHYYGQEVLVMVVLEEWRDEEKDGDPFTIERVKYWRVKLLEDGVYKEQVWKSADKKEKEFVFIEEYTPTRNGQTLDYIPIVIVNTSQLGAHFEDSMLADLVNVNHQHYIFSADQGSLLHYSSLPTLVLTGVDSGSLEDGEPIRLGTTSSIILPPGADAKIVEAVGASNNAVRQHLIDLEAKQAVLGARLLDPTAVNANTATAEVVKTAAEQTSLSALTQTLDAGLSKLLELMFWWSGNETAQPQVSLNKDFLSSKLSPSQLTSLTDAYIKGGLSAEVYLYQLEQGEMLPPQFDMEAETERLTSLPTEKEGMNMRTERDQGPDTTIQARANNAI